eukprot:TRINITY_DN17248_c0_g1_i1.p1 TRINITY_DN17248_c0_g1~~TRINITY_DN17248_c0_g1_i1.p1  ORF type:complete len:512 (+),score=168.66 TRINITY_DN17248_c0_g1_i1:112-1536(+)
MKKLVGDFINALKANDLPRMKEIAEELLRLSELVRDLDPNLPDHLKELVTELRKLSGQAATAAQKASPNLVPAATRLTEKTAALLKEADNASPSKSPEEAAQLKSQSNQVRDSNKTLISTCRSAATAPPGTPEKALADKNLVSAQQQFDAAVSALASKIPTPPPPPKQAAARKAEGPSFKVIPTSTEISSTSTAPPPKSPGKSPASRKKETAAKETELVIAAKKQAEAAEEFAKEAREKAQQQKDASKKQSTLADADRVNKEAQALVSAAQSLANNPLRQSAQRSLDSVQSNLAGAITKLATGLDESAAANKSSDLGKALQDLSGDVESESEPFFGSYDSVMADLQKLIAEHDKMDSKSIVASSRLISEKIAVLAKALQKRADLMKDDPILQEQLRNTAKVLRDKAMQVKILSAVNITSKGGNEQVKSASLGLCTSLKESLTAYQEATIKLNVKRSNNRTAKIRNILSLCKAHK